MTGRWFLLMAPAFALALFSCGGADNGESADSRNRDPVMSTSDAPKSAPPPAKRRELPEYSDPLETATAIDLPTLSDFWHLASANNGLPAAGTIDPELPLLGVQVTQEGTYSTSTRDTEWVRHGDDMGVLESMRVNAGEIDFDVGLSNLQVVLAIDQDALWSHFMGVREMMQQARCFRLFVVTSDSDRPTLRLLRLSLPRSEVPENSAKAWVNVQKTAAAEGLTYDVVFGINGKEHRTTGTDFISQLSQWAENRSRSQDVLGVRLPLNEPVRTLFQILDALAPLGMTEIRFGA